jgi:hypothetical protein
MQEWTRDESRTNEDEKRLNQKPDSDATSKEMLKDLEDNEKSSTGKQDERKESSVPSPDGSVDDKKEPDDAGPM